MRHIIAATDFSPLADNAVTTAAEIARAFDASLTVAHAFDPTPIGPATPYPVASFASYPSQAVRDDATRHLESARERLARGVATTTALLEHPSASAALCDLAERCRADLIVLGTHGRTGVSRLLLGSVAEATLRHASCSVLATRGSQGKPVYSHILVCTDFSPASKQALVTGAALARVIGARITLLHVYVAPPPLWGERQMELGDVDATLRAALIEQHQSYFEQKFEVALMHSDNAALAIADYAAAHAVDLVVVATHGRTGLRRMLLGSVAEATVRHAPCDVWAARS